MESVAARVALVLGWVALGCSGGEGTREQPRPVTGPVQVVARDLALYANAVSSTGPDDVWIAGGQRGDGQVLHYDGTAWSIAHLGPELLWGIAALAPDEVHAVGELGAAYRFDGTGWRRLETGTNAHLYAVWGSDRRSVWAAGGNLPKAAGFDDEAVLRFDGQGWSRVELPAGEADQTRTFRAVAGRGADDVYVVGEQGAILHFDGSGWRPLESPTFALLRGAVALPDRLLVVGAHDDAGLVVEGDPPGDPLLIRSAIADPLRAAATRPGDEAVVIGAAGYLASFSPTRGLEPLGRAVEVDLVGIAADRDGYAIVGGNVSSLLTGGPRGAILRIGSPFSSTGLNRPGHVQD